MENFEESGLQNDSLFRALAGDASSPLYGGSLREQSTSDISDHNPSTSTFREVKPVAFLIASIGFLILSILYW